VIGEKAPETGPRPAPIIDGGPFREILKGQGKRHPLVGGK